MYLGEDKVAGAIIGSIVDSLEENSTINAPSQRAVNDGIRVLGKASKNLFNGVIENGRFDYNNGSKTTNNDNRRNSNPIPIEPDTTYIFSNNGVGIGMNIMFYDENYNYLYYETMSADVPFTTSSKSYYINFFRGSNNCEAIQLEKGSVITEYEKYYEPSILVKDSNGYLHEVPYVTGKASKNLFNMLDSSHFVFREKSNSYQTFKLSAYSSNEIKVKGANGNYTEGFIDVSGLKPNTSYVVSYKIKENTLGFNPKMSISGNSSETGTLTINVGLNNGSTNASSSNYVIFTDIQLEEGAVITSYEEPFEPIISVKDSEGNNHDLPYVAGKISKNLLGVWEQGGLSTSTGAANTSDIRLRTSNYINVVPNEDYYVSVQDTNYAFVNFMLYDENAKYIGEYYNTVSNSINGATSLKVVFPSGCYKVKGLFKRNDGGNLTPSDIATAKPQLEKGSTRTSYEKYYEPSLSIKNSNGIFQEIPNNDNLTMFALTAGDNITIDSQYCYKIGKLVHINCSFTPTASIAMWAVVLRGAPSTVYSVPVVASGWTDSASPVCLYEYEGSIQNRQALTSGRQYRFSMTYIVP